MFCRIGKSGFPHEPGAVFPTLVGRAKVKPGEGKTAKQLAEAAMAQAAGMAVAKDPIWLGSELITRAAELDISAPLSEAVVKNWVRC